MEEERIFHENGSINGKLAGILEDFIITGTKRADYQWKNWSIVIYRVGEMIRIDLKGD